MTTSQWRTRAAAAFLVAASAARSDAPTIPGPSPAARGPRLAASTMLGDTAFTSFRVDPNDSRMIVIVGTHKVDIPPGAICDVETSGYGADVWDAPCAPETS